MNITGVSFQRGNEVEERGTRRTSGPLQDGIHRSANEIVILVSQMFPRIDHGDLTSAMRL